LDAATQLAPQNTQLSVKEIETVHRVVTALRKKLEDKDEAGERG
jgi:hypothetical protein